MSLLALRQQLSLAGQAARQTSLATQAARQTSLATQAAPQTSSAVSAATPDATPLAVPEPLVHFLNRSSFGIRESDYQRAAQMGYAAFVEAQLVPQAASAAAIENIIAANLPSINMTGAQLYTAYPPAENKDFVALGELRAATLLRQIYSPNQLFEVMVEFWTNHFSVEHVHGYDRIAKTIDDQDIRKHALGTFKDLLNANARSPAMLFYLDNYVNVKSGAQENYARELMELHTLGVDGGYTEDDVKNVARAFTGWSFNRTQISFLFTQRNHDTDEKLVLGKRLAKNRGMQDGQDVLDILAAHPSTAKLIATKLVRRFVSDTPPANLVDKLTALFLSSGGDITVMLRALFASVEFLASADLKVKRPQEYVQSVLRVTDAKITGTSYNRALMSVFESLGQQWCNWPAPNGYPDVASYWINTTAWLARWNFVFAAVEGRLDRGIVIDALALCAGAKTPEAIVDALSARLLRRSLSASDRAELISSAAAGAPVNIALRTDVLAGRAREMVALMLSSRYFNYR
jgi:uncharacterized protein (DUF1800 family)